jgi:hypothetical protein
MQLMSFKLHIVSFDVPFPANYGGVIDVFYKIKALHQLGVKIHLHCFEYHRPPAEELNAYCEKVFYYPRKISSRLLFHKLPYIVISRQSDDLIQNIQKNSWPVLMEGMHCTLMLDRYWPNRKMWVRTHNVEHAYYQQLAKAEKNLFKKYYFLNESTKLEAYEPVLSNSSGIIAITESEKEYFHKYHHTVKTVPAFHGNNQIHCQPGTGKYILYQGNLSIAENNKAALYLAETLGNGKHQLVIAGSSPRKELKDLCRSFANVMLVANPSHTEMEELIKNAQVNTLITYQNTGFKLKLLNALFNGRHCIVNKTMVEGTGLEESITLANIEDKSEFLKLVDEKMKTPFTEAEVKEREILMAPYFDRVSAQKLMKTLFETL